jgi:hypothetical protein
MSQESKKYQICGRICQAEFTEHPFIRCSISPQGGQSIETLWQRRLLELGAKWLGHLL